MPFNADILPGLAANTIAKSHATAIACLACAHTHLERSKLKSLPQAVSYFGYGVDGYTDFERYHGEARLDVDEMAMSAENHVRLARPLLDRAHVSLLANGLPQQALGLEHLLGEFGVPVGHSTKT